MWLGFGLRRGSVTLSRLCTYIPLAGDFMIFFVTTVYDFKSNPVTKNYVHFVVCVGLNREVNLVFYRDLSPLVLHAVFLKKIHPIQFIAQSNFVW